ncbi:MAG: hemerythrin domain-containing protein [Burkholderiales bacterium]|nr:hemerythrin domain-containing protein [Burkholderiales bacterium]
MMQMTKPPLRLLTMTLGDEIRLLLEAPTMNASDVRTLLRHDQDEAIKIARDMYESESAEERRELFKRLRPDFTAFARAEEREVYEPLQRRTSGTNGRDHANEGAVEHSMLDDLMERMARSRKSESDEWKAHAGVLLDFLERHVEAEQTGLFDALAEHFTDDERAAIGRRFVMAKARMSMKAKAA